MNLSCVRNCKYLDRYKNYLLPFGNAIIQLCKHVVAKVTLVPCSVKLTGKRDKFGHGEVTINNARIIPNPFLYNFHLSTIRQLKSVLKLRVLKIYPTLLGF